MTPARLAMMPLIAMRDASACRDGKLRDPDKSKGRISATGRNLTTPIAATALPGLRGCVRNEMRVNWCFWTARRAK
jgi:hypothetical protein